VFGPPNRLSFDLSADPPLPETDILALLFSDVTPGRNQEVRRLSGGVTPAQQLLRDRASRALTSPVSSEFGRVVQQTFGVDQFELTPTLIDLNSQAARLEPGARVTIGQRLSDRVYLTYSRSLSSTTRNQVILLEYDQTDRLSWILSRNEDRTYALDVRIRHVF
jgi:autotransporter translocation and assembly factor TamB